MRKPTASESVFLAGTLTTALLTTATVVPNVMQELQEDAHQASEELKRRNLPNPADVFTSGLVIGLVTGAIGATKVISDKLNTP
ncbi:hypothetical protein QUB05_07470 [Microcoleus sp. F10-C6]|uniref:hypothetical protein n=1 Tax=unclassified Microcoleus TaxID=2642155 RepID=UPI002FD59B1E